MTDSKESEIPTEPQISGGDQQVSDTIDAVRALLRAVNIAKIVVVDDEFEPNESDLLAVGHAAGNQTIDVPGIGAVDFSSEPEVWRGQLSDAWATLEPAEKRRALEALCEHSSTLLPKPEQLHLFYELEPEIGFHGMAPDEWEAQKDSVIDEGLHSPTLVLFDLHLGNGKPNEGARLAVDLYNADTGRHIWAGLLTNKVELDDEDSAWSDFNDNDVNEINRFSLSKAHLAGDAHTFPEALRVILISKPAASLSSQVKTAITSSVEEAALKLSQLSPAEFERIVFGLAKGEGTWEVDMLLRLFDARLRSNVRDKLHSNDTVRTAIEMLRTLDCYSRESNPVSLQAQQIYREELYENPDHLNRLHLPVELGDIYQKIGGTKEYVLVGQPCDLMVRGDGKRTPELSFVTLLQILGDTLNPPQHRALFELPAFKNGQSAWVALDRPCTVPVECVDYCALNGNGRGLAPTFDHRPEWILPSWEKRWKALAAKADKLRNEHRSQLIAAIKAQYGVRKECEVKPDIEGSNFNLGLMRTRRIRSPYARALLTSYTAHLARDAHEPAIA